MGMHDYFRGGDPRSATMRALLSREADLRSRRFGLGRREFLNGAMGALAAMSIVQQWPRFRSRAEAQAGFTPPPEPCYDQLQVEHATFEQATQSTALDWEIIQRAAHAQQAAVPNTVLNMLSVLSTLYGGFGVTQLTHMTQTATRALRANASDELVLLGLLHDVGEVLTGLNHAEIVGALVRPYVSNAGYQIVRTHMEFQLKHYGDQVLQPTDMRDRYAAEAWFGDAARFSDDWDQASFDPAYATLPLEEFEPLIRTTFARIPEAKDRPEEDCDN